MLEKKRNYYMLKGLNGKWSIHENRDWNKAIKQDLTEQEALMWLKLLREDG